MPVDGTKKCPNCGAEKQLGASHCANCGHAEAAKTQAKNRGAILLMVVAGIVAAIPAWYLLTVLSIAVFSSFGPQHADREFYVPWGPTGFFIFMTLLAVGGLVFQARRNLSPATRAFAITFLAVLLGLFSLCDLFALSSHSSS